MSYDSKRFRLRAAALLISLLTLGVAMTFGTVSDGVRWIVYGFMALLMGALVVVLSIDTRRRRLDRAKADDSRPTAVPSELKP